MATVDSSIFIHTPSEVSVTSSNDADGTPHGILIRDGGPDDPVVATLFLSPTDFPFGAEAKIEIIDRLIDALNEIRTKCLIRAAS